MADLPAWRKAFESTIEVDDLPTPLRSPIQLESGEVITQAPGCFLRFDYWNREPIEHDFGKGKSAMTDLWGEHLFGEIAILRLLEMDGWSGRWVNNYGGSKFLTSWDPDGPNKDQTHVPIEEQEARELLARVFCKNGQKYGGCWDIFAWKDRQYLFAEAKAQRKERASSPRYGDLPTENQGKWLKTALDLEDPQLELSSFVFVQWDYR